MNGLLDVMSMRSFPSPDSASECCTGVLGARRTSGARGRSLLAAALALVTLAVAGCGGEDTGAEGPPQAAPLRILFVGNSLTAENDLPGTVERIAQAAGRRRVETRTVAPGGVSLEEHWTSTGAREALAEEDWDAVVLQQGPSSLPESRAHLVSWATRWADEARTQDSRPSLLTVWPEEERASALPDVIASYEAAAEKSGAELLPAGAAWRAAWRRDPGLGLYGADGFHPSELGTELAALVVYAGLTGAAPEGLPLDDAIPADSARILREAAAEALAARS